MKEQARVNPHSDAGRWACVPCRLSV